MNTPDSRALAGADSGFSYRREQFEELVDTALAHARKLGASDAGAEASEGCGLSVSVRKGELENVERNRDKSLGVTVYLGQRRGNASTSDFSRAAIEQTVQAAYDIARFTAEDPVAGLPDAEDIVRHDEAARDLDLFHPWAISSEAAAELARVAEAAAFRTDKRITNSEGASVSAQQSHFFSAHTRVSAAVTPVRAIPSRSRPSPARATTCSATTGTARTATPKTWRSPRPSAAMPPSARSAA
jgi:PmbA protein